MLDDRHSSATRAKKYFSHELGRALGKACEFDEVRCQSTRKKLRSGGVKESKRLRHFWSPLRALTCSYNKVLPKYVDGKAAEFAFHCRPEKVSVNIQGKVLGKLETLWLSPAEADHHPVLLPSLVQSDKESSIFDLGDNHNDESHIWSHISEHGGNKCPNALNKRFSIVPMLLQISVLETARHNNENRYLYLLEVYSGTTPGREILYKKFVKFLCA